jgi:hypothetical protein
LRSSLMGGRAFTRATPHSEQNFAPRWFRWPQEGQTLIRKAYGRWPFRPSEGGTPAGCTSAMDRPGSR